MAKPKKPTVADLRKQLEDLGIEAPKRAKKADLEALLADRPVPLEEINVFAAVIRDLREIEQLDPDLARSGLAASALTLARNLDDRGNSATAHSNCANALINTLDRLWELAPEPEEGDRLDDLSARRAARLAGAAAA